MTDMNLFANRPTTRLAAGITPDSTTLSLAAGSGLLFPNPGPGEYFRLVVQVGNTAFDKREYMKCTARTGDALTVERGQEGTIPTNFAIGDEVTHVVTAQSLNDIIQSVVGLETSATKTTIDDTPPASPDYADRWIKPSTMTEMVWVPNEGTPGAWINPADAGSLPLPVPISKGGTGGTTPEEARVNLGISSGGGTGTDPNALPDGDAMAPSLAFASEPGLGMYRVADHDLAFTAAGSTTVMVDAGLDTSTSLRIFPRTAGDLEDTSQTTLQLFGEPDSGGGANQIYMSAMGHDEAVIGAHINTTGAPVPIRYLAQTHQFERGPVVIQSQQLLAWPGNVSTPGLSFSSDTDTGMYSPGDNTICFATGGVERMRIADDGTVTIPGFSGGGGGGTDPSRLPAGSAAAPSLSWANDTNTGLYNVPGNIGMSVDGVLIAFLDGLSFGVTKDLIVQGNAQFQKSISATQAIGTNQWFVTENGTAAAPTYTFFGDSNAGMFHPALNTVAFSVQSTERLRVTTAGATVTGNLTVSGTINGGLGATTFPNGSAAAPSIKFTQTTNSGLYSATTDAVSMASGGVEVMRWNAGITLAQTKFAFTDGSINAPGLCFTQESNCGLSRPSASQVVMSTAGVERERWTTNGALVNGDFWANGTTSISNGSNVAPSLNFASDNNTGLYWGGADQLVITAGGAEKIRVAAALITLSTPLTTASSITCGTFQSSTSAVTGNASVGGTFGVTGNLTCYSQFKSAQGTRSLPGYSWDGETDTGIYRQASRVMRFTVGDSDRLEINATAVALLAGDITNVFGQFQGKAGSIGSPSFAFAADPNTGMYNTGPDGLGLTVGGAQVMGMNAGGVTVTGSVTASGNLFFPRAIADGPGSSVSVPAYVFSNDTNTGLYWASADVLGVAAGGAVAATLSASAFAVTGTAAKPGGGAWADTSDLQFKHDIHAFNVGMRLVRHLKPKRYKFTADTGRDPNKSYVGLIAQEVEDQFPEAVTPISTAQAFPGYTGTVAETKLLDTSALFYVVVNALQELDARIKLLEHA